MLNSGVTPKENKEKKNLQKFADFSNYPSIVTITEELGNGYNNRFEFKTVQPQDIKRKIDKLKTNKSAGYDNIPPKIIKLSSDIIVYPVKYIVNQMIETNTFPNSLKLVNITPVYKKKDALDKTNYRPVSVLTSLSKISESVIAD